MSDKHLQTRKTLSLSTGIFGLSSLTSVVGIVIKILFKGLAFFTSFNFFTILALLIVGISYFRGAWKSFSDLEYGKSKRKGLLASLSTAAAAIIAVLL